jgi:cytidine deaminase
MKKTQDLVKVARALRLKAYAPYSGYAVGAALLGTNGRVYRGCNVENASYGLTVCAERAAYFQAVADGCRSFAALAIATPDGGPPCGACLQVAREFGTGLRIILAGPAGPAREAALEEFLPRPFLPKTARKLRAKRSR